MSGLARMPRRRSGANNSACGSAPRPGHVTLYRLDTGERLLTDAEARQAAEAEVARLREELRRRDRA